MAITKTEDGKWLGDFQPGGRAGKRIRKKFETKKEAKDFEIWIQSQSKNPEWVFKKDQRRLAELFKVWFDNHGQYLKSGEDTIARIKAFAVDIGNPPISELSADHFQVWRSKKIKEGDIISLGEITGKVLETHLLSFDSISFVFGNSISGVF